MSNTTPREQVPVIVPGWSKAGGLTYNIYLVDVTELAVFLPAGTALKTNDFNAAKAYIAGFRARDQAPTQRGLPL